MEERHDSVLLQRLDHLGRWSRGHVQGRNAAETALLGTLLERGSREILVRPSGGVDAYLHGGSVQRFPQPGLQEIQSRWHSEFGTAAAAALSPEEPAQAEQEPEDDEKT